MPLSAGWLMLPGKAIPLPYILPIWVTLPTIALPMSSRTGSSSSSAAMTKGLKAYSDAVPTGSRRWTAMSSASSPGSGRKRNTPARCCLNATGIYARLSLLTTWMVPGANTTFPCVSSGSRFE